MVIVRVALAVPLHRLFDYRWLESSPVGVGQRVRVPFGKGERVGVVIAVTAQSEVPEAQLKDACLLDDDLPPLPGDFLRLCEFVSTYYQAPLGEVMLQALPAGLRRTRTPHRRCIKASTHQAQGSVPAPTPEQAAAVAEILGAQGYVPFLLHGVTGSGKTEVYLRAVERIIDLGQQALILVPEINLTPQLEARVRARFPAARVVALHSEMGEAARERNWCAAFAGEADIVLGTRLAVFTPMPALGLVVVDEEHDASFKQQDGVRYSARDVAVMRASMAGVPVVLGSATPSLESWSNAVQGRYRKLNLTRRAHEEASLPAVTLIDTRRAPLVEGFSERLVAAIETRLERGEQSLIFLNRRGYAPVLACGACGWVSRCRRCAANLVLHLADRRLRCHHCGFEASVPVACPTCGNQDIHPFGRGTQRLEQWLCERFPAANVLRVDRDSAKRRTQWEAMLARIQAGDADILVGTQMLAKGHDFPKLTLVGVLGADAALFAADCRASERLFAQLMQVAGRAGRASHPGEVLIQTQYPDQPLFRALQAHDYPGFAEALLRERAQAGFPPYAYQAILRAEHPEMATALAFLNAAAGLAEADRSGITFYDAVPMRMARLASLERAQILVESVSRRALQAFLPVWREAIAALRMPSRLRWHLEVDPLEF